MNISCITSNPTKIKQYEELCKRHSSNLCSLVFKTINLSEIQSLHSEEVVRDTMKQIRRQTKLPFIVDDVSLVIHDGAYPGALIKHLLQSNTLATLSKFLPYQTPVDLTCTIGYFDGFNEYLFTGELHGTTNFTAQDPHTQLTLDQLIQIDDVPLGSIEIHKNHRGKAYEKFVKHLEQVRVERDAHDALVTDRWSARASSWESIREDANSYVNYEQGYARFDLEVQRVLPLIFGNAIDIGCGDGAVTRLLTSHSGLNEITGIDISPEMTRVASERTTDSRVRYCVGTFPTSSDTYQLITSRGVVLSHMHQSEVIPTCTAMSVSLKPNGYLIFDVITDLANHDDSGRMNKNQYEKSWIIDLMSELGLVHVSFNGSASHRVSTFVFHKPQAQSLYFATGNTTKVMELQQKCKTHTLHLANIDVPEIKSDDIVEVAKDKARKSFELLKHPVMVTDGGIFIHALNGFPGPNSKQAATLLGAQKILDLLKDESDRTATRRNCLVIYDGKDFQVCVAEVPLTISNEITDSPYHAYPLDTILIPTDGRNSSKRTYKQMPIEERVSFTELPIFEKFIASR